MHNGRIHDAAARKTQPGSREGYLTARLI
jgi:hypothetical protein